MAVRQETGLGQFPKQQSERGKGFLSTVQGRVTAGIVAGTIAFGGFAVYEAVNQNNNEPGSTPIPGGIIESSPTPTPFSTESPTITLPPSPEVSPSPTPTSSPTETPTSNEVHINKLASMDMTPYGTPPFYFLEVRRATIVSVGKLENGTQSFTVMLGGGNVVKKDYCKTINISSDWTDKNLGGKGAKVTLCEITGAPLTIRIGKNTHASTGQEYLGQGPAAFSEYLKVGMAFPDIKIGLTDGNLLSFPAVATQKQIDMNKASFDKLLNGVGKSFPRTYTGFKFFPGIINIPTNP